LYQDPFGTGKKNIEKNIYIKILFCNTNVAHKKSRRAIQNQQTIFQATERKITEKTMVQESEIRISAFIAEHNLPFCASDHLPELITKICPDSKIAA
jgi:hypothetical protein